MNIQQILEIIAKKSSLSKQESWWLLEHVTKKNKEELITANNIEQGDYTKIHEILLELSQSHKPLAYILSTTPFLNLTIHLTPPILIPRHETEEWVAELIEKLHPAKHEIKNILDIGTGTGCIALALAQAFSHATITAIDINPKALQLAKINAEKNNIKNITFLESNLFEKLLTPEKTPSNNQKFDVIVSNPPYINPTEKETLAPQVINWEDHNALFAHEQGMAIIKKILKQSVHFLTKNDNLPAQLVIEIDQNQKDAVLDFAKNYGWIAHANLDSFGKWRTIWCKKI